MEKQKISHIGDSSTSKVIYKYFKDMVKAKKKEKKVNEPVDDTPQDSQEIPEKLFAK
jgi:uncharacterized protein YktA (UPF0223 family)